MCEKFKSFRRYDCLFIVHFEHRRINKYIYWTRIQTMTICCKSAVFQLTLECSKLSKVFQNCYQVTCFKYVSSIYKVAHLCVWYCPIIAIVSYVLISFKHNWKGEVRCDVGGDVVFKRAIYERNWNIQRDDNYGILEHTSFCIVKLLQPNKKVYTILLSEKL